MRVALIAVLCALWVAWASAQSRIRFIQASSTATVFSWGAVSGAASYQLEVGTSVGGTDTVLQNVGNVVTSSQTLSAGTYYARVRAIISGVTDAPSAEFYVLVP